MKNLIRKILKEERDTWFDKSKEERHQILRDKLSRAESMMPKILKIIDIMYGDKVRVDSSERKMIYYGSDMLNLERIILKVYVEDDDLDTREVKSNIWDALNNYLGIDLSRYGVGLDLEVYKKTWSRI